MASQPVLVRIPATVGSIAGAMNCAAVALDASLNVKVTPRFDGRVSIRYFGEHGERVPRDKSNLVVQALQAALRFKGIEFAGADFEIYSSVPVAVGLGSSTAAVLAGLIAAGRLHRLELQESNLFDLAATYESRSDSLRAAWSGGFVAGFGEDSLPTYKRVIIAENFALSVVIPEVSLVPGARAGARHSGKDQAASFRRAQVLYEFIARQGNGALDFDSPLPPTCEKVAPGLEEALQVRAPGLLAVFVCGSGPAVGLLTREDPAAAVHVVRQCFERQGVTSSTVEFRLSNAGAREWNGLHSEVTLSRAATLGPSAKKISLIPV